MKKLYAFGTAVALTGICALSAAMATGARPFGVVGGICVLIDAFILKEGGGLL